MIDMNSDMAEQIIIRAAKLLSYRLTELEVRDIMSQDKSLTEADIYLSIKAALVFLS